VHKFTELARRRSPVAVMSAVDVATAEDSPRRQLIHRPAGLGDEVRVLLRANGSTWGAACLHRESASRDVDPDEQRFLAEVAGDIGRGLRASLSHRPATAQLPAAPGVLTMDRELSVTSATDEAEQLTRLLRGTRARERQVAELLILGPRTDEIAARLHISRHTLRDHVKSIFAKVGATSRSELTALVGGAPAPDLV
jgi:DNA-binding CsgD family transcriptional regulator